MFFKKVYKVTPLFMLISGPPEKAKNGTLAKQTFGVTDVNLDVYTQLDSGRNMGRVKSDHTCSSVCQSKNSLYVCMHVCVYLLYHKNIISN